MKKLKRSKTGAMMSKSFKVLSLFVNKPLAKKTESVIDYGTIAVVGAPTTLKCDFILSLTKTKPTKSLNVHTIIPQQACLQRHCAQSNVIVSQSSSLSDLKFLLLDVDIFLKVATPITYRVALSNADAVLYFGLKNSKKQKHLAEIKEIISLKKFQGVPVIIVAEDVNLLKVANTLNVKVCNLSSLNTEKDNPNEINNKIHETNDKIHETNDKIHETVEILEETLFNILHERIWVEKQKEDLDLRCGY